MTGKVKNIFGSFRMGEEDWVHSKFFHQLVDYETVVGFSSSVEKQTERGGREREGGRGKEREEGRGGRGWREEERGMEGEDRVS